MKITYRPERKDIYEEIIKMYKAGNHTKSSLHYLAGYKCHDVYIAFQIMRERES